MKTCYVMATTYRKGFLCVLLILLMIENDDLIIHKDTPLINSALINLRQHQCRISVEAIQAVFLLLPV